MVSLQPVPRVVVLVGIWLAKRQGQGPQWAEHGLQCVSVKHTEGHALT